MNIFSPNCLSPAMQLDKNTQDIKTLFANQPQIYYTSEDLDASDVTVALNKTDITDADNIGNQPILISANGRLYKITTIVDSTVYCKYEATLPQGRGVNFLGSRVSGNEYHEDDVVTYTANNITTSYILITSQLIDSTTPPPLDTTNWVVFASGGMSNWKWIYKTFSSISSCYEELLTICRKNPAAIINIKQSGGTSSYNQGYYNVSANLATPNSVTFSSVIKDESESSGSIGIFLTYLGVFNGLMLGGLFSEGKTNVLISKTSNNITYATQKNYINPTANKLVFERAYGTIPGDIISEFTFEIFTFE